MIRKRIFVGVAAAALVLSGTGVGAANAISYVNASIVRATTTYSTSTHKLKVYDANSDGWGAYADWAVTESGGAYGKLVNENGAGTSVYSGPYTFGHQIIFNACSKNGNVNIGCSGSTASTL